MPQSVELARTLMDFAREDNDPARLAIAHRALGYSMQMAGALADADDLLAGGITLADSVPDARFAAYGEHPGMVCRVNRALICAQAGYLDEATQLAQASIEHARTRNSPFSLAWSLNVAADVYVTLRDASVTEQLAREAIALSREHRLPQWLAFAQSSMGRALCWQGDLCEGVALQQEGMRSLHAVGSVLHTTRLQLRLSESSLELGELDKARSHLDAAFAHLRTHHEGYLASEMYRVQLMLLRAEAAPDEALEETITTGLEIARSHRAHLFELRLATCAARMWQDLREREWARELLEPVYGWFTEGFDTADLKEAKALLDQLQ